MEQRLFMSGRLQGIDIDQRQTGICIAGAQTVDSFRQTQHLTFRIALLTSNKVKNGLELFQHSTILSERVDSSHRRL